LQREHEQIKYSKSFPSLTLPLPHHPVAKSISDKEEIRQGEEHLKSKQKVWAWAIKMGLGTKEKALVWRIIQVGDII
jgi:hypothetical protein